MTDSTNLPAKDNSDSNNELKLENLTDQNWLFIKHYLETGDIRKSYELAKYEGLSKDAPYVTFKKLKPYIEELLSLGSVSRLRLMNDLDKALAIPMVNKESLTPSEWLRIRKFASTMIPELKKDNKVSVLIVNRYQEKGTEQGKQGETNKPLFDLTDKEVIDADPIE